MASIEDLEISIRPFNMKIFMDAKAKHPRISGAHIILPKFDVEDEEPHNPVKFTDVLEYVCQKIDALGFRLSFVIEKHEGKSQFKQLNLFKHFGMYIGNGHEALNHTSSTEQIWQWSSTKETGGKTERQGGIAIDALDQIPISELRYVQLSFSVAPAN